MPEDMSGTTDRAGKARPGKRRRVVAYRLLLSVGAGLLALGACEIAFRLLGLAPVVHRIAPGDKDSAFRHSSNPILGYVFRENHRRAREEYTYINAHGQHDIERSYAKPPGRKRILLLGDSIVAGACLDDVNDTISRQMEKMYADEGIEVLNLSVPGYCTRAEVELLKVRGLKYRPDLVVLVFANNDYLNINLDMKHVPYDRPKSVEWLFLRSHLFRFVCLKLDWFGFHHQHAFAGVDWELYAPNVVTQRRTEQLANDPDQTTIRRYLDAVGPNNVASGLRMLKELAGKHGFDVLVAIWPHFEGRRIVDLETETVYMRAEGVFTVAGETELGIERIAKLNGIPSYRLSAYFRTHAGAHPPADADPEKAYTTGDHMHASAEGARVAAEAIKAIIDANPQYLDGR